ncbi:MAG: peptidylprolyl isomerase [Chloroflexia bacterium]
MSQSQGPKKRRSSTGGGSGSSKNAARRTSTTPPVQRTVQQTTRARVDKVLPPFTTQRYVAIWILGMIPLALVLLLLLRPADNNTPDPSNPGGQVAPTSVASDTIAAPTGAAGRTELPVVTKPTGTTSSGLSGTTTGGTVAPAPATGGAKYMIIETDKGRIVAQLHIDPSANVGKTIANFEQKANAGEFNGRVFHRVENWVIQGGDPTGTGSGGGTMPSEYNQITFKAGALGIARGGDSAINNDSQFFFVKSDSPFLDGQYTNWGQVIEGQEVVNQIAIGDKMNKVTISSTK